MFKIVNPLTDKKENISSVLYSLASQNGCDGEPYDQIQVTADYINNTYYQIIAWLANTKKQLENHSIKRGGSIDYALVKENVFMQTEIIVLEQVLKILEEG